MAIQLSTEKKTGLFMMLASKTIYDVGIQYGFDKHYKDAKAIKGAVYRNYAEVKNNPDKYGISKDTYDLVLDAMASRAVASPKSEIKAAEEKRTRRGGYKEISTK